MERKSINVEKKECNDERETRIRGWKNVIVRQRVRKRKTVRERKRERERKKKRKKWKERRDRVGKLNEVDGIIIIPKHEINKYT